MKIRWLIVPVTFMALYPVGAAAETVSQKEASQLARTFFDAMRGELTAPPKMVYSGKDLTTDRLFSPFYVYESPSGGFVVIAADNKAFPVLAYSPAQRFPGKEAPGMRALLAQYARDIERVRYDGTVPVEAIKAWNGYNLYVHALLTAQYNATDPSFGIEEAAERIESAFDLADTEAMTADLFTPWQWQEAINQDLDRYGSIAVGLMAGRDEVPAIVHGRKGDMYRIEIDGRNDWLVRLAATETVSPAQIADFAHAAPRYEPVPEETPFALYDDFVAQTRAEAEERERLLTEITEPSSPRIHAEGGGHFTVTLPAPALTVQVYSLDGSLVDLRTVRSQTTVPIDLDREAPGFYIANFITADGRKFGIKLYK